MDRKFLRILSHCACAYVHMYMQRFEDIFKANNPKLGGSYFIQCKAEHAKNTLHQKLVHDAMEMERQHMEEQQQQQQHSDSTHSTHHHTHPHHSDHDSHNSDNSDKTDHRM